MKKLLLTALCAVVYSAQASISINGIIVFRDTGDEFVVDSLSTQESQALECAGIQLVITNEKETETGAEIVVEIIGTDGLVSKATLETKHDEPAVLTVNTDDDQGEETTMLEIFLITSDVLSRQEA